MEMTTAVNLRAVRMDQRRVAAMLGASNQVEIPAPLPPDISLNQLFRSKYYHQIGKRKQVKNNSNLEVKVQNIPNLSKSLDGFYQLRDKIEQRIKQKSDEILEQATSFEKKKNDRFKNSKSDKHKETNKKEKRAKRDDKVIAVEVSVRKSRSDFNTSSVSRASITDLKTRKIEHGERNNYLPPLEDTQVLSKSLDKSLDIKGRSRRKNEPKEQKRTTVKQEDGLSERYVPFRLPKLRHVQPSDILTTSFEDGKNCSPARTLTGSSHSLSRGSASVKEGRKNPKNLGSEIDQLQNFESVRPISSDQSRTESAVMLRNDSTGALKYTHYARPLSNSNELKDFHEESVINYKDQIDDDVSMTSEVYSSEVFDSSVFDDTESPPENSDLSDENIDEDTSYETFLPVETLQKLKKIREIRPKFRPSRDPYSKSEMMRRKLNIAIRKRRLAKLDRIRLAAVDVSVPPNTNQPCNAVPQYYEDSPLNTNKKIKLKKGRNGKIKRQTSNSYTFSYFS